MSDRVVVPIKLSRAEYEELAHLAQAAGRTTQDHAALLLRHALPGTQARVVAAARGRTPNPTVEVVR